MDLWTHTPYYYVRIPSYLYHTTVDMPAGPILAGIHGCWFQVPELELIDDRSMSPGVRRPVSSNKPPGEVLLPTRSHRARLEMVLEN